MRAFVLSPVARRDLASVLNFLAERNPTAAQRYARLFRDAFRHISQWPDSGLIRRDLAPTDRTIRAWVVSPYLVIYDPVHRPVRIVAILHGAQNLPDIISGRLQ